MELRTPDTLVHGQEEDAAYLSRTQIGIPHIVDHTLDLGNRPAARASLHRPVRGGLPPRALRRVHAYIEEHLGEPISLHQLAEIAGLSLYHFARAFKKSEGVPPHQLLLLSRVRRARELLANTERPLSEIALDVGFADQSHLARRFREHFGISPRSYRWLNR